MSNEAEELWRFLARIFSTLPLLMGVLSIFRLNFLSDNIGKSFQVLNKALESKVPRLSNRAPREKITLILEYFKKPDDVKRGYLGEVDPILHDIFNQMWYRVLIIRCFTALLIICGLSFAIALWLSWPSETIPTLVYWTITLIVELIFLFAGVVVWTTTNWKVWKGFKNSWEGVKERYLKADSPET